MKKQVSIFLAFAMLLTILSLALPFAANADEEILIRNQADLLAAFSSDNYTNEKDHDISGNYRLADDITISGMWKPDIKFIGTFDGNGHTIYIADGATLVGGVFGQIGGPAIVKNLTIRQLGNANYKPRSHEYQDGEQGAWSIGVLAGCCRSNWDARTSAMLIKNVTVYADMLIYDNTWNVGGLVGYVRCSRVIFDRCAFNGNITNLGGFNNDRATGGIVGAASYYLNGVLFKNCVNYGTISTGGHAGGILGAENESSSVDAENLGSVTLDGKTYDYGACMIIDGCVNYGSVTGSAATTAGIVGMVRFSSWHGILLNHNINYGEITNYKSDGCAGGIGGLITSPDERYYLEVVGNVNYGFCTAISDIVAPITVNCSHVANQKDKNFCNASTPLGGTNAPNIMVIPKDISAADAVKAIGSDSIILGKDGKIVARWAVKSESSGEPVPATLTLDYTVPDPTGTAISNAEELAAMESNGVYYLANDIEVNDMFPSIADFAGVLHGNGHTIVLNGAEFRGGLFRNLAGGKVYNLNITESKEKDADSENIFRAAALNEGVICVGAIAGYGYGTLVNVTVDCAIGGVLKQVANGYVGGLIGAVAGGDTIIYGCKNLNKVVGGFSGGLVGLLGNNFGKVEISRCVNWGSVTSSIGTAGGLVAIHDAAVTRMLLLENINYGDVATTNFGYCGGILGMQKNLWDGSTMILCNINYGTVTNNSRDSEGEIGCPGGIIGSFDADGSDSATVSGNGNFGNVVGNKNPNQLVAADIQDDGLTTAQNNFAVAGDVPATIGSVNGIVADAQALEALNTAWADTFAGQEEKITLKWAADADVSATVPTITYSLKANENPSSGEEPSTPGTSDPDASDPSETTTSEPATQTEQPAAQEQESAKKKGCGSILGSGAAVLLVLILGTAFTVCIRRKEF